MVELPGTEVRGPDVDVVLGPLGEADDVAAAPAGAAAAGAGTVVVGAGSGRGNTGTGLRGGFGTSVMGGIVGSGRGRTGTVTPGMLGMLGRTGTVIRGMVGVGTGMGRGNAPAELAMGPAASSAAPPTTARPARLAAARRRRPRRRVDWFVLVVWNFMAQVLPVRAGAGCARSGVQST
jgi:hypothetical protein